MSDQKPSKWFAVEIVAEPAAVHASEYSLDAVGCIGTETDHLRKGLNDDLRIVGYFDDRPDEESIKATLEAALADHGLGIDAVHSVRTSEIEDRDWLAEWKKHWKPTVVGPFVVSPPWDSPTDGDKHVIRIEPNMAFGTGTHETTRLCLEAIGREYRNGDSVLDVGTGTGVLAIAAAMLGRSGKIVACDTDADSVKIARENAAENGVGDRIEFFEGSVDLVAGKFDLVIANLTIDVIMPLLQDLIELSNRQLLLSGILAEQRDQIERALGDRHFSVEQLGEWISVLVSLEK